MTTDRYTLLELNRLESWQEATTSARCLSFRRMGSIAFGTLQNAESKLQFAIKRDVFGDSYKELCASIIRGQFLQVTGTRWVTGTGELTLLATDIKILQANCSGLPDKQNGIQDEELIYRKRYMSTSTDLEAARVFLTNAKIISFFRRYLEDENYIEFQTPILDIQASGAMARPFITHSNELDKDLYLRIATETSLKKLIIAGYERVFDIGQVFRNEGVSRSHSPEFLSLEYYEAFSSYVESKAFFLKMLHHLLNRIGFPDQITVYDGVELNWNDIRTVSYHSLFELHNLPSPDVLSAHDADELFKKTIRPTLIQPIVVIDYPSHMSPMAKRRDDNPAICEQWQLITCGWEIVKAYSELSDASLQRKILEEQMAQREGGDAEAMMIDEPFLEAMEYGLPPTAGVGIGLSRLVAILTDKRNIRDVIFFPMMG